MTSKYVEKVAHEACGSSNGVQVYCEDGKYTGYCWSCNTYIPNPYGDKPEGWTPPPPKLAITPEERAERIKEINGWGCHDLPTRELLLPYLAYFGIKVGVSEQDGITPSLVAFPVRRDGELVTYKLRPLDSKKFWSLGDSREVEPFGWQEALSSGAPRLIITEGEYDAVAIVQAIKEGDRNPAYAKYYPAVISVSDGAQGGPKQLARYAEAIRNNFKDIVLALDQDEVGKKSVEAFMQVLPEATVATLPSKDANQCIKDGRSRALRNAVLFKSEKPKNSRIVYGSSLAESAKKEPEWGNSFPWDGLTDLTRGERPGEVYYWGAGVKMGKSELLNALAAHNIIEHKKKVFVAKPEEANNKTYKLLVGKVANRIFHDPTIPFDHAAWDKAEPKVGDNVAMLDLYQHLSWEHVKADLRYAAMQGYSVCYIDPITNFLNQTDSSTANDILIKIAAEAMVLAKDLDITIHFFCHLNAPKFGEPHERGGKVQSYQFAGSRGMMRSCNYMLGLEGNKDPDLPLEERNCRTIVLLEDREFGQVGSVPLYWDNKTGAFNAL